MYLQLTIFRSVLIFCRHISEYREFLENDLPVLLEDVPLNIRQTLIYQHDDEAPAHFSRQTREMLDARFSERWMDRGQITWPTRSPDLNVLDYFV